MTFGLTPQGFNAMRLADVKQSLEDAFIAQFGDINLDPQSVFGQQIGVLSKSFADLWENLEDVYLSQYPNSASGVSLDNVVGLNAITRLPATQTSVVATCSGLEGTLIPANSQASIPTTGDIFYTPIGGLITAQNADEVIVNVETVTTQPYTVILSNQAFTYSLPVITFSNSGAIFVSSNVITLTINGVVLTPITYAVSSNATLLAIANQIAAFIATTVATPTNPNIITITPAVASNININFIEITGGASQATYAITYRAPANQNAITAALTANINSDTPIWTAVDNMNGTFSITANDAAVPFSVSLGLNLLATYQSSPITFLSTNYGPIPCPINALTYIITPIAGWNTVNNSVAGVTGTLTETDAQLRIRRQNSLKLISAATVDAIQAGLLQKVAGVTSAIVFENRTLTQLSIVVVFPAPFNSGDTISFNYDTSITITVPYDTSQAQTMADFVTAVEAIPAVASATYGGSGNQTLTINMNILQDLTVNSVTTDVSAQSAVISGGRTPKSFEAVVQGGTNENVANTIWLTKPAGIETYGTTSYTITDSQGNPQVIYFSRPTPIYISVQVALTLNSQETFPIDGALLVQQAIYNYGSGLGVGIDVFFQRVLSQIFTVSGIASGSMTIAATLTPTQTPSFGTSDIIIADNQISIWNLESIVVTVA